MYRIEYWEDYYQCYEWENENDDYYSMDEAIEIVEHGQRPGRVVDSQNDTVVFDNVDHDDFNDYTTI